MCKSPAYKKLNAKYFITEVVDSVLQEVEQLVSRR